jgi:hypothetical protein
MNNRGYQQFYPQYPQYQQPTYQQVVQQPTPEPQIQGIKFLNAEQINEIYEKLYPSTQVTEKDKVHHIENIKKTYH